MINGRVLASKRVDIPASGKAPVEFAPLDIAYGFNRCEIRIEAADPFSADDTQFFTVRRSDPERVLFVHRSGETRSTLYFEAALAAASQGAYLLQSVSVDQTADLDPSRFAFVVLSDTPQLPSIFERTLAQYVAKGGSVLLTLGTGTGRLSSIPLWGGGISEVHDYARNGGAASVGTVDFTHPALLQAEHGKDNGGWADTKIFYASAVDPGTARVAARLGDGTPLLLDRTLGEGHLLLLTTGLDNLTNDLPLHPVFVAFVDRTARYLSGSERLSGSRLVDAFVPLRSATETGSSSSVEVIDPDGKRPLSLAETRTAQTLHLDRAGFYQIRLANGRDAVIGVNADRRESDLEPMPPDVQHLWSGSTGDASAPSQTTSLNTAQTQPNAGLAQSATRRVSLWWYVMLLALLLALAESTLAGSYMGMQREGA